MRVLRSVVMVRVGGGWATLEEFLIRHDPCRGKRVITKLKYFRPHAIERWDCAGTFAEKTTEWILMCHTSMES